MKTTVFATLVFLVAIARAFGQVPPQAEERIPNYDAKHPKTIIVHDVPELLAAIGSNRIVWLAPGDYYISGADSLDGEWFRWENGFAKHELHINNVQNLTLRAQRPKQTKLYSNAVFGDVIVFDNCQDLHLMALKLGRDNQNPNSQGGPLRFERCDGVLLEQVTLRSNRLDGLQFNACGNVRCERTRVQGCHGPALKVTHCNNVVMAQSAFRSNDGPSTVHIDRSNDIQFHDCAFLENRCRSDSLTVLLDLQSSTQVGFFRGFFNDNAADHLIMNTKDAIFFRVQFKDGNHWGKSKFGFAP